MIEPQKWASTLGSLSDTVALPDEDLQFASFKKLFPALTQVPLSEGGVAPQRTDFNTLFKLLGDNIFYIQQGGVFSYSDTADYERGAFVKYNNELYLCIQDNSSFNKHAPTDAEYWLRVALNNDLANYLPLAGGNITGNLTVKNKNVVRSVNGVNADAEGNTDVTKLKSINLGNFTENLEVTTLDTIEGNCVLAGANGKSHNYDMEGTDWAFIQVHSSIPYQKFQLGTANAKELMYRVSDNDDTSWEDWLQVSLIAEQGSNYIRYDNGIQICWDSIVTTQSSEGWGSLQASKESSYKNYPKAFISKPSFCVTNSLNYSAIISTSLGDGVRTPNITVCRPVAFSNLSFSLDYIAIGRWK